MLKRYESIIAKYNLQYNYGRKHKTKQIGEARNLVSWLKIVKYYIHSETEPNVIECSIIELYVAEQH